MTSAGPNPGSSASDRSAEARRRYRHVKARSRGREIMVFSVDEPDDLPGVHAELIASALPRGEKASCLLYAPRWEGRQTPFGLPTPTGSHALAVTPTRFVISRDPHSSKALPSVRTIAFCDVLAVEVGKALLAGWFGVRFVDRGRMAADGFLYEATVGAACFAQAVRHYRRSLPADRCPAGPGRRQSWAAVGHGLPSRLTCRLEPLIIEGEPMRAVAHSSAVWGTRRRLWHTRPVCLAPEGVLVATGRDLLYAVSQTDLRPRMWSFGVNVSCMPYAAIAAARIVPGAAEAPPLERLRLTLCRQEASVHLEALFDQADRSSVEDLIRWFGEKTDGLKATDR